MNSTVELRYTNSYCNCNCKALVCLCVLIYQVIGGGRGQTTMYPGSLAGTEARIQGISVLKSSEVPYSLTFLTFIHEGAYSDPPDLLAAFKGPISKGREGKLS